MKTYRCYYSFSFYGPLTFIGKYKAGSKNEAAAWADAYVGNHLAIIKVEEENV